MHNEPNIRFIRSLAQQGLEKAIYNDIDALLDIAEEAIQSFELQRLGQEIVRALLGTSFEEMAIKEHHRMRAFMLLEQASLHYQILHYPDRFKEVA